MNATFHTGDVLTTHRNGKDRFVRVGTTDPDEARAGLIYVQDCDGAGFPLNGKGRHLLATSLANRYQLHYSPSAERRTA